MNCEDKLEAIKEEIGNPQTYMEETKVFALAGATMEQKYNALWRLSEIYRKKFLSMIMILEEES